MIGVLVAILVPFEAAFLCMVGYFGKRHITRIDRMERLLRGVIDLIIDAVDTLPGTPVRLQDRANRYKDEMEQV